MTKPVTRLIKVGDLLLDVPDRGYSGNWEAVNAGIKLLREHIRELEIENAELRIENARLSRPRRDPLRWRRPMAGK